MTLCYSQFAQKSMKKYRTTIQQKKLIQNRPCNLFDEMDLSKEYE